VARLEAASRELDAVWRVVVVTMRRLHGTLAAQILPRFQRAGAAPPGPGILGRASTPVGSRRPDLRR
jgi:hypothetical protein